PHRPATAPRARPRGGAGPPASLMLDPPGGTRYPRSMRGYRCLRALRSRAWVALLAVTLLLVALPWSQAWAGGGRGGNWHGRGGNWHGHGHGRVFIGSSFW